MVLKHPMVEKSFKISRGFQIKLIYKSERTVGEIRILLFYSELLKSLASSESRGASVKLVSRCVSEVAVIQRLILSSYKSNCRT